MIVYYVLIFSKLLLQKLSKSEMTRLLTERVAIGYRASNVRAGGKGPVA